MDQTDDFFIGPGADLRNKNLEGKDLSGLDLTGANFTGANLKNTNLSGCNLTDATLNGLTLSDTIFDRDTNFTNAFLMDVTIIDNYTLDDVHFDVAFLTRARIFGSSLMGAHFEGTDLTDAQFNGSFLHGTYFNRVTIFQNTNFTGTYLNGAHFDYVQFNNTNLTDAKLRGAEFNRVNFRGTNVTDADFTNSTFINYNNRNNHNLTIDQIRSSNSLAQILAPFLLAQGQAQTPPAGVAYEIHNAFESFASKKDEFLNIIQQPNITIATEDTFATHMYGKFRRKIIELFTESSDNQPKILQDLDNVKNRLRHVSLSEEQKELALKSINFVFTYDGNNTTDPEIYKNFQKQYIICFLEDSCRAYTGSGDTMSCVKGILERFVLSIGCALLVICIDRPCNDEKYMLLDKLLNDRVYEYDVGEASQKWFAVEYPELENASPEERKARYISDIIADAQSKNMPFDEQKIIFFANAISYAFDTFPVKLGGQFRNKKQPKKSINNKKTHKKKINKNKTHKRKQKKQPAHKSRNRKGHYK